MGAGADRGLGGVEAASSLAQFLRRAAGPEGREYAKNESIRQSGCGSGAQTYHVTRLDGFEVFHQGGQKRLLLLRAQRHVESHDAVAGSLDGAQQLPGGERDAA